MRRPSCLVSVGVLWICGTACQRHTFGQQVPIIGQVVFAPGTKPEAATTIKVYLHSRLSFGDVYETSPIDDKGKYELRANALKGVDQCIQAKAWAPNDRMVVYEGNSWVRLTNNNGTPGYKMRSPRDEVILDWPRDGVHACESGDRIIVPKEHTIGAKGQVKTNAGAGMTQEVGSSLENSGSGGEFDEPSDSPQPPSAQRRETNSGFFQGVVSKREGTGKEPIANAVLRATMIGITEKDGAVRCRRPDVLAQSKENGGYEMQLYNDDKDKDCHYFLSVEAKEYAPTTIHLKMDENGVLHAYPPEDNPDAPETIQLKVPSSIQINQVTQASHTADEVTFAVETRESQSSHYFAPEQIERLPLSGIRNIDELPLLLPGVLPPPAAIGGAGPGITSGVGSAGQFAINGMRARENNFSIEGSDNNEEDVGVRRQGFVALTPQSIESFSEVQVITALADARYGRNIGGQVFGLTKSGTSQLHGTAYGFVTNQRLNARNYFNQSSGSGALPTLLTGSGAPVLQDGSPLLLDRPGNGKDPLTRVQTGLTLGGQIGHRAASGSDASTASPWYWFVSAERQDIHAKQETHFAVPTVRQRGAFGTGESGFAGQFFPASIPGDAIFSLYPFPNNPHGPYGVNTFTTSLPAGGFATLGSIKVDHALPRFKGLSNSFSARYSVTDDQSTLPTVGEAIASSLNAAMRLHNFAMLINTSSKNWTQTVRLSYGRTSSEYNPAASTSFFLDAPLRLNSTLPGQPVQYLTAGGEPGRALLTQLGYLHRPASGATAPPTLTAQDITGPLGQLAIAGFSPVGIDVYHFPQQRANNTYQIADSIQHVAGRHSITFGFDIRRNQVDSSVERNYRARAVFDGLLKRPGDSVNGQFNSAGPSGADDHSFTGATLAAMGTPTGMFQTLAAFPDSSLGLRFNQVNFFFQDNLRIAPNLRFNLGGRFELNTTPDSSNNKIENAMERKTLLAKIGASSACGSQQDQSTASECQFLTNQLSQAFPTDFDNAFGSDRSNLEPRVGFAWDVSGDGRTAIRGGFGAYKGQFPSIVLNESRNFFPDFLPLNYGNFSTDPSAGPSYLFNLASEAVKALSPKFSVVAPGTLNTLTKDPITVLTRELSDEKRQFLLSSTFVVNTVLPAQRLKNPYSLQYNLSGEHQLGNYVLAVSFVGTQGRKLLRITNPNGGVNHTDLLNGRVFPTPSGAFVPAFQGTVCRSPCPTGAQSGLNDLQFAPTVFESSANSSYSSLQGELRSRYVNGLQFRTAFTYSHSIDDASDFFDTAGAFALPQDGAHRSERASSNFDARFRAVVSFVWDVEKLLIRDRRWTHGLQLTGIFTEQTGQPFTVNSAIDVNRDGNLTDRLDNTTGLLRGSAGGDGRVVLQLSPEIGTRSLLACEGCNGRVGRNTFRAQGIQTLDLALTKRFKLSERTGLMARVEGFNIANRPQFGIPVRILEQPGFGSSVTTSTPGRTVQFDIKLSF